MATVEDNRPWYESLADNITLTGDLFVDALDRVNPLTLAGLKEPSHLTADDAADQLVRLNGGTKASEAQKEAARKIEKESGVVGLATTAGKGAIRDAGEALDVTGKYVAVGLGLLLVIVAVVATREAMK